MRHAQSSMPSSAATPGRGGRLTRPSRGNRAHGQQAGAYITGLIVIGFTPGREQPGLAAPPARVVRIPVGQCASEVRRGPTHRPAKPRMGYPSGGGVVPRAPDVRTSEEHDHNTCEGPHYECAAPGRFVRSLPPDVYPPEHEDVSSARLSGGLVKEGAKPMAAISCSD